MSQETNSEYLKQPKQAKTVPKKIADLNMSQIKGAMAKYNGSAIKVKETGCMLAAKATNKGKKERRKRRRKGKRISQMQNWRFKK